MPDAPDRLAAALADRYPIERELGHGGMATVYLAHDVKHGRRVAIKVLRPELAATLGADRFVREITIAAQLSHPHILPLFDSGEADGFLYYVMPYVEGESLRDRLQREQTLDVAEVVRLTQQIASALGHAHAQGVIHRDIKPENILLTGDQAIVADFGIARAVEAAGGDQLTGTGLAVGTPAYMSPEQAFGGAALGPATDVYSLGCVVFEMLTGHTPFEGPTAQAMLAQHAANAVPALRTSKPALAVPVERAVQRALGKEPDERFESATGFSDALVHALTPEAAEREARRMARRRWRRGLAVAGIVAVLSVGGWWLNGTLSAHPIRTIAVLPASNMTRDSTQNYFVDGVHEALVTELQRDGIAVIARQSVLQYRGTDKPIRQIAQELGVDGLIQPAVGREGDSVLVDVTLYDGRSQLALWTDEFPAHMSGVLALYRTISGRVATAIGAALSEQTRARLAQRDTVDPRAYEAVLKGNSFIARGTAEGYSTALQYYEKALAIDSLNAPAHAGMAWVWTLRAGIGVVSSAEARGHAQEQIVTALRLDPQLVSANLAQAQWLFWVDWDFDAGEAAYRRLLALDPNDASIQSSYGMVLLVLGHWDEGVQHADRARQLDPLDPGFQLNVGFSLAYVRRTEEAIPIIRDALARNPGGPATSGLADVLYAAGQKAEALRLYSQIYRSLGHAEVADLLTRGVQTGDYSAAWEKAAAAMAASVGSGSFFDSWTVSNSYALAGDAERAMDWLERAVQERHPMVPYLGIYPVYWSLHDNPRFRALADRVGVPLRKGTDVP